MIEFPNIRPEIFSFSFGGIDFALRWYAVSYLLGFLLALRILKFYSSNSRFWKNNEIPIEQEQIDRLLTYLIIGVIFGGRLGYVIFYNLSYYLQRPFDILRVWDGGMAFHGGFVGVVIALIIFARRHFLPLWTMADLAALATPPGLFLGRIANFINAELWGRPTTVSWGVIFPGQRAQDCPGIVGECARHPSQLYEAGLEGLLTMALLLLLVKLGMLRYPGIVAGSFFVSYGMSRIFVEYFRVPDPQFFSNENLHGYAVSLGDFGMTMGQTLCLPMVFLGLLLIIFNSKLHG